MYGTPTRLAIEVCATLDCEMTIHLHHYVNAKFKFVIEGKKGYARKTRGHAHEGDEPFEDPTRLSCKYGVVDPELTAQRECRDVPHPLPVKEKQ